MPFPAGEYPRVGAQLEGSEILVEWREERDWTPELVECLRRDERVVLVLNPSRPEYMAYRRMLETVAAAGLPTRVILRAELPSGNREQVSLYLASQLGGLFLDRLGYGIWLSVKGEKDFSFGLQLSRDILQSAGVRRYKTEFISCPGCGRTLYNLQESVARVKKAFAHLNKLKIAVMGCVVNGPGEMGDADYGYVGAGNGKVNLFKGKQLVRVGIPEGEAIEALKQLIMDGGDWESENK